MVGYPYLERPNLHPRGFRHDIPLPYGLSVAAVKAAMDDLYDFFYRVNAFMVQKGWDRLEEALLGNTFSGVVSELLVKSLAKHCPTLARNARVGGRPDLLPAGVYPGNAALNAEEGIELKASRQSGGWQGHNPESGWVVIFQLEVDMETQPVEARAPFKFVKVMAASLESAEGLQRANRPVTKDANGIDSSQRHEKAPR